jgi:hypothetical protein
LRRESSVLRDDDPTRIRRAPHDARSRSRPGSDPDPAHVLLSMHVQLGGANSLEVNEYNHFKLTQTQILDAHNNSAFPPSGGTLSLPN